MLDFNYTLLVQFFNFLILLILLNFLLFKPVLKVLRKRQDKLGSLDTKADANRSLLEGYEKKYEETRKEKQQPIISQRDTQLKEAHSASMKVIEQARVQLADELAKVKDAVKKEADNTLQALRNESDRLSQEIAQKILRRGA